MPKNSTPVPEKVQRLMDEGLGQRKAVSYAGLGKGAKGK